VSFPYLHKSITPPSSLRLATLPLHGRVKRGAFVLCYSVSSKKSRISM
jgi:hypothetical protein